MLKKQIMEKKQLRLMMDGDDTVSTVKVDLAVEENGKIKLLLYIPWFKPDSILTRNTAIITETGRNEGAVIPAGAVTKRQGKKGVYLLRGNRVIFKEIEGRPASEGLFLVTEGISIGDAVVERAENAREGRIQPW